MSTPCKSNPTKTTSWAIFASRLAWSINKIPATKPKPTASAKTSLTCSASVRSQVLIEGKIELIGMLVFQIGIGNLVAK